MKKTVCLGIESTAHTAGAGIVDEKCWVLANQKHSHATKKGGMVPRELAEHHAREFPRIVKNAVENSAKAWKDIDCIAYSAGPGIGPALGTGAVMARMLAVMHGKPLVPVNHAVAHIEIAKKMCNSKNPLVLYVSGGNTQVIGCEAGKYRVYGETLDIGVGNLLDSFGREVGMGFPAGPSLDREYFEAREYVELPYTVKGMDTAFSGLLTAAKSKIGKVADKSLSYSVMHNAFAMLTEITERALAHTEKKELLVTGGVAASKALDEMLGKMCNERGVKLEICPQEFAADNGAMIAWAGLLKFRAGGSVAAENAFTEQKWRVDSEAVNWG